MDKRPAPWWRPLAYLLGAALLVSVAALLLMAQQRPSPRPGWRVIRPPHEVSALAIDEDWVWVGGRDGLRRIDRRSYQSHEPPSCLAELRHIRALLLDGSRSLWVGHQSGLTRLTDELCEHHSSTGGLPDDRVNSLVLDGKGVLWVGTWKGAVRRDGNEWRPYDAGDGLAADMVNAMLPSSDGAMWFGSYVAPRGGLARCRDGRCQRFTTKDGLPHNNVTSIVEAGDGTVWVGTGLMTRGGAAKLEAGGDGWRIAEVIGAEQGLPGPKVRSLFRDASGLLWFGTEANGLARRAPGGWQIWTERDGLSHQEVKCIAQDDTGAIWLGTRDGVTRVDASAIAPQGEG
ncbi:MAG: transcriptional regulator [Deltaproteobacteria bacterium]|nr:MAG: transcriptional regulator [Deltaproteobacteria bacterium]